MDIKLSGFLSSLTPYTPGEQPQDKKYIKLNTNESPFAPPDGVINAVSQSADSLMLYSDPQNGALVSAIADYHGVAPQNVYAGAGSDEVLALLFAALAYKQRICYVDITYGFYDVLCGLFSIDAVHIPLKSSFVIDPDDYRGKNMPAVIANPNAPTGIALGKDKIEYIAKNLGGALIVDEAYVDFGAESAIDLIKKHPNIIVTRTFSKSRSLAGMRLGYAVADKSIIDALNTVKFAYNPYNISRVGSAAGIASLRDEKYFEYCRRYIIEARDGLTEGLKNIGFTVLDSKTNFVFAAHPKKSGQILYEKLKEKGILVRYFGGQRTQDYIRITVGLKDQCDALTAALKQITEEDL